MATPARDPATLTEWTGVLIADAQTRYKPMAEHCQTHPVLVMHVRLDNPHHNHLRVEQPFQPSQNAACQAAARRYRKGMRVTVQAPISHVHITAEHTAHIHIHTTEETTV